MVKIHQFKFRFRGTAFLPWYRFFRARGIRTPNPGLRTPILVTETGKNLRGKRTKLKT